MIRKLLVAAAALGLAAPAAAHAQDYDWYQHQQDHAEHGSFHDEADAAHQEAHERGFYSEGEHSGYHRALRDLHDGFHDDHPGTRHDGYRLPREHRSYYGYRSYRPYYGNSGYGYSPYGYAPYGNSGVTFVFRR